MVVLGARLSGAGLEDEHRGARGALRHEPAADLARARLEQHDHVGERGVREAVEEEVAPQRVAQQERADLLSQVGLKVIEDRALVERGLLL